MNPRESAANAVARVLADGKTLPESLAQSLSGIASPRDRALVQALAYGVFRHYWELDFLVGRLVTKGIKDPFVHALALTGVLQLRHMRVKPHAAIGETVAAAHRRIWAKPLLNAILRNYQRQHAHLDPQIAGNRSARYSHPVWLIDRISDDWGDLSDTILAQNNAPPPMTIRVSRIQASRDDYLTQLLAVGINAQPGTVSRDAIILEKPVAVEKLPRFNEGAVSVQDEAPQLASAFLEVEPGMRTLDVCAAPGGKTVHLLESVEGIGQVIALDASEERAALIRENLTRCRVRADIIVADATKPASWWDGNPFDRILLDAPCSATGVIRRHPDIKVLRRPEDIPRASELQRQLLQAVWPTLRVGGRLLYSTCSILREENEYNIDWFCSSQPDAMHVKLPELSPVAVSYGQQFFPGDRGMDGFYYACLEKRASSADASRGLD